MTPHCWLCCNLDLHLYRATPHLPPCPVHTKIFQLLTQPIPKWQVFLPGSPLLLSNNLHVSYPSFHSYSQYKFSRNNFYFLFPNFWYKNNLGSLVLWTFLWLPSSHAAGSLGKWSTCNGKISPCLSVIPQSQDFLTDPSLNTITTRIQCQHKKLGAGINIQTSAIRVSYYPCVPNFWPILGQSRLFHVLSCLYHEIIYSITLSGHNKYIMNY